MRVQVLPSVALAGAVSFGFASASFAGGCGSHHCGAAEGAVVRPAYNEVVHEPAVVGTRVQRIETSPGYWTASQVPAQTGFYQKSVVVRPSSVSYRTVPAQYRTVHETVVVRPATVAYEYRPDRHGRMVKCAVHVPAVTRTVAREVMVSPGHTVATPVAAVYRTVTVPVVISPARTAYQYTPPRVDYVAHPITLKAATARVIHHPAVHHSRRVYLESHPGFVPAAPVAYHHQPRRSHWLR